MKIKAIQVIIVLLILLGLYCPYLCVYGATEETTKPKSDYYFEGFNQYGDSYYHKDKIYDNTLLFFPIPPENDYKSYAILYNPDKDIYLFYTTSQFKEISVFGSYPKNYCLVANRFKVYQLTKNRLSWFDVTSDYPYETNQFKNFVFVDSSTKIDSVYGTNYYDKFTAQTGYHFYWTMQYVEKSLLLYFDKLALYVQNNEILRTVLLFAFGGEILIFVLALINKIGDMKNEEAEE